MLQICIRFCELLSRDDSRRLQLAASYYSLGSVRMSDNKLGQCQLDVSLDSKVVEGHQSSSEIVIDN